MAIIGKMNGGTGLQALADEHKVINLRKKTGVLSSGEANVNVFYLESGYVRSYILTEEGWCLTLNIFSPGTVFPLSQVLGGIEVNPHEFETLSTAKIRKIPAAKVVEFMKNNPDEAWAFLQRMASGTEGLINRMRHLFRSTAERRVISGIDLLEKKFGVMQSDQKVLIEFPHTHQDIADIAGVTRETVTKVLLKLAEDGIIERMGKQTLIKNKQQLLDLLSVDEENTLPAL